METKTDYNFASAGIENFLTEIKEPKQEFEQSKSIFDSLPDVPDEKPDTEPPAAPVRTAMTKGAANAAGKLAATVADTLLPMGLGLLAKSSADNFKASDAERGELVDALSEYLELKGDIPPGLMVIIIIAVIYGSKIPAAIEMRKQQTINDKQAQELKDLREKLKKYEDAGN